MSTMVPVFGTYVDLEGVRQIGSITFTARAAAIADAAGDRIIIGAPITVPLNPAGSFKIVLPATDAGVVPLGFTYQVTENFGSRPAYDIAVPAALAGSGLDLTTVSPVSGTAGSLTVSSVAGRTGAVVLGESDITGLVADLATALAGAAATASLRLRSRSMTPVRSEYPNVLTKQMSFGPSITNTGPNVATVITNPIVYPVALAGPVLDTTPPWTRRGFANEWPVLVHPEVQGGPYLVHQRTLDNVADLGPGWYEFWTDAPDIELDYLSSTVGTWRLYVEDARGPSGIGLQAVTSNPEALITTGTAQYRRRYSFGLLSPGTPVPVAAAGGTLANGLYGYRITAFDGQFAETQATAQATITTSGGNGTVNLTWTAATNTAAGNSDRTINSYNIYRTDVGGAGTEKLIGNTASLSFSDTGLTGGALCLRRFSNASARRMRRIILETYLVPFGGITLNKADTIYPALPANQRVLFIGDSLTQGVGANYSPFSYAAQAAQRLGFQDPDVYGILGTGYIVPAGVTTFIQRLPYVLFTPDLIITAGGRNDVGQTPTAITAAVAAYLAAVKAQWPNTPHIVLSPWYTADADVVTVGTAVKAACTAASPAIPYVDLLALGIIVGTGTVALPVGDGNADWVMSSDRIHWTTLGHTLVAAAVAAQVEAILAAATP